MRRVPFFDAYKQWRNRARKFNRESIVNLAVDALGEPAPDAVKDLERAPWITLLMVKWVCQDRYPGPAHLPSISYAQLDDLRQRLWNFPAQIDTGERSEMPLGLFMRQLMRPQIGFQRGFNRAFVREAALLAEHGEDHPLRAFFRHRTGFDLLDFIDLSFALCARIFEGERDFTDAYLRSLHGAYTPEVVSAFLNSISRTTAGLTEFCRSLPDADDKVASELFEFPVLARYPFFRRGNAMFLWHRALFFRGLEGFVHSVLGEQGDRYMQRFGRLFEHHVTAEARKVPGCFLDEDALVELIAAETKVPDGLLSFPGCNVFIESKAGLFHESVMAVGNSTMFARKTRAIRTAVRQARATSVSLRRQRRAPREVLEADADYLLVVTNKDLGASRGTALQSMYPAGTLDCPDPEAERLLPLGRIYVVPVDDFERVTSAAASGRIELPGFLAACVARDEERNPSLNLFEQHLKGLPLEFSDTVNRAIDAGLSRLKGALRG